MPFEIATRIALSPARNFQGAQDRTVGSINNVLPALLSASLKDGVSAFRRP